MELAGESPAEEQEEGCGPASSEPLVLAAGQHVLKRAESERRWANLWAEVSVRGVELYDVEDDADGPRGAPAALLPAAALRSCLVSPFNFHGNADAAEKCVYLEVGPARKGVFLVCESAAGAAALVSAAHHAMQAAAERGDLVGSGGEEGDEEAPLGVPQSPPHPNTPRALLLTSPAQRWTPLSSMPFVRTGTDDAELHSELEALMKEALQAREELMRVHAGVLASTSARAEAAEARLEEEEARAQEAETELEALRRDAVSRERELERQRSRAEQAQEALLRESELAREYQDSIQAAERLEDEKVCLMSEAAQLRAQLDAALRRNNAAARGAGGAVLGTPVRVAAAPVEETPSSLTLLGRVCTAVEEALSRAASAATSAYAHDPAATVLAAAGICAVAMTMLQGPGASRPPRRRAARFLD